MLCYRYRYIFQDSLSTLCIKKQLKMWTCFSCFHQLKAGSCYWLGSGFLNSWNAGLASVWQQPSPWRGITREISFFVSLVEAENTKTICYFKEKYGIEALMLLLVFPWLHPSSLERQIQSSKSIHRIFSLSLSECSSLWQNSCSCSLVLEC